MGATQVKAFTLDPLTSGLQEYETNLNSVQTILANTQASGAKLKDVNAALLDLNRYSDKTIYNFSQMAKNIGTFTAAGVDLKTATGSIKGIANLAALSGSNAEQASTAMYQLSQAISAGRVSLQDWNSVVNAGMGGTVFQRALAQTAVKMGTLNDSAVQLKGKMKNVTIEGQSFRESIQAKPGEKSWLTSDVLTKTLQQFTGDLSDAELAAQGFNKAEIKAIQAQAKTAVEAATKVKTLTQLIDVAKETAQSGWAQTWQLIFGDFGEARTLFTGASNAINGMINASSNARNSMLEDWKALGGRKVLIDGIKTAFEALGAIIKPIKEAFRDVFPRKTGEDLLELTKRFRDFFESLKINTITSANLRSTFKGLFAILDIGVQIIKGVFSGLKVMFGALSGGESQLSNFTGNIGDVIFAFDQWLKQGDRIGTFFRGLGKVLSVPLKIIQDLAGALASLFNIGGDTGGISSSVSDLDSAFGPLGKTVDGATTALDAFFDILGKIKDFMAPVIDELVDKVGNIGTVVGDALASNDFSNVFSVIQTGLIAGIFLTIKKALGGGLKFEIGLGGALKGVAESLNILKGSLVAIQNNIKANTMLQISVAVGLLAAAVVALSLIKPEKLSASMAAITAALGQLMASLFLLDKMGKGGGFLRVPFITVSLIALAAAIDLLVIAIVALAQLSWEQLAKGLVGVGGALLAISLAVGPLSAAGPGFIIASTGMIALSTALIILGGAVKIFGNMDWGEMGKGLLGVVLAIDAISLAVRAVPPSVLLIGPGLIMVGLALNIIAASMKIFGSMDMATIGKGILGMAGALVVIGAAMNLFPPTLPITAAGLILVGIALTGIAGAVKLMGSMDVATLAKGIGGLAGALIVLAVGLNAMMLSLPGAAALVVAAAGLAVLVPVIGILGNMDFKTIAKGLGFMVLSLATLAVAGTVAAPGILALAAALTLLGVAITLVGAGLYLMTSALVKLAGEGAKGIGIVIASLTALMLAMPKMIINFLKGLVEIVAALAELAPKLAESFYKILIVMLNVGLKAVPKFAELAIAIIGAIVKIIDSKAADLINAGFHLLLALLKGISDHIEEVTNRAIDIAVKFIQTLASRAGEITTAGFNLLVNFLKGIANNIARVVSAAGDVILAFVRGIAGNISKVAEAAVSIVVRFVNTIANNAGRIISAGTDVIVNVVKGIGNALGRVATAAIDTAVRFINALAREIPKGADDAASAVIRMMHAMADVVRRREPEFIGAFVDIGKAIVDGLIRGIKDNIPILSDVVSGIGHHLPGFAKKALGIKSPSTVFAEIGRNIVDGLAGGIEDSENNAITAVDKMAKALLDSVDFSDEILNPVITPVLDLSNIQNGSQEMASMMNVVPISAAASFKQGAIISGEELARAIEDADVAPAKVVQNFEQNNYSPESLSSIQIYRQTKNQLAQAESALSNA
jgi:tape measure domain-containing protein